MTNMESTSYTCQRRRGHVGDHGHGRIRWPQRRALAARAASPPAAVGRPDLHARFLAVVQRAIAAADAAEVAFRASIRASVTWTFDEGRRLHRYITNPRRW